MIKFFRNIRHKLLSEHNFRRYFIYAVGEIFLVVIGILIALQINNWNENRKAHIEETKFLKNIRTEIVLDTLVLVEITSAWGRINTNLIETLKYLDDDPTEITEEKREIISRAIVDFEVLTPVFKNVEKNNEKLSEGILLNINNELNTKYQQYLDFIKSNSEIATKFGESLQLMAITDVHSNVDLDYVFGDRNKADFKIEELRNNRLMKNAFHKSIRFRRSSMNWMNEQKIKAVEILNLLDKELK